LIVAGTGALIAVVCLALAAVLDATLLYVPGLAAVVAIFIAREAWLWDDDLRGWLIMYGSLLATIVIVALFHRLA